MNKRARVIAFYLPQYHPIPENDEWWGKGFTEWTNVGKAKPLFKGHYQPRVPADLGYYDLRLPIVREQQAEMAREAGVEGFCYWHYWFGNGKTLLAEIFDDVLKSGKPDFPFCLGWANHTWTRRNWNGAGKHKNEDLLLQTYPGEHDHIQHFYNVLPAFIMCIYQGYFAFGHIKYILLCISNGFLFYLANYCTSVCYKYIDISKFIPVTYLNIVFTFLISVFILGEPLFLTDLIGALLIIGFQFWNISNPIISGNVRNKSESDKEEFIKNMENEGDEYVEIDRLSLSVEP